MSPFGLHETTTTQIGKSRCRNEAIAEALHYMHIIEAWGTGIPRLYNRSAEYGLPEPLFEEFGDGIKVTMFRKVSNAQDKICNATKNMGNALKEVSNAVEKVINGEQKVSNTFNIVSQVS